MIERFTPEELDQIRKELKEVDHVSQKDKLLKPEYFRLVRALGFKQYEELRSSFSLFDVKNAITMLVDHALKNYVPNPRGKKSWKRSASVPDKMASKYVEVYGKIVDVLEEAAEPWK